MATADEIFDQMMNAGGTAFGDGWKAVRDYAPAEFRKMAIHIEEIAKNVAKYQLNRDEGYSPETAKKLMKAQRIACESVLVATARLTEVAVQKAMDAMYDVLRKAFKGIVEAVL
jgi:hypothetical protein